MRMHTSVPRRLALSAGAAAAALAACRGRPPLLQAPPSAVAAPPSAAEVPAPPPALAPPSAAAARAAWVPMAVGERWVYNASWAGISVGSATIAATDVREVRGRKCLHIACTTEPTAYIRGLYRLKYEVASDIDLETGCPLRYSKHIEEGDRLKDEYIEFDPEKGTATYYKRNTDQGEKAFSVTHTMEIPAGAQDPLSCLLAARALPLKEGEDSVIKVNTDKKTYDTHMKAVARKPVYVANFGDLRSVQVDPALEYEGIFPSRGRLGLWVEEETRVPLKLQLEIKVGTIYGTLVRRDGAPPFTPIPKVPDSDVIRVGRRPRR